MLTFTLAIPLICAFSISPANSRPQYANCINLESTGYLPSPYFYDSQMDDPTPPACQFKYTFSGNLYYNDSSFWLLDDLSFSFNWDWYYPNEGVMENFESLEGTFDIENYFLTNQNYEDFDLKLEYQVLNNSNYSVSLYFGEDAFYENKLFTGIGFYVQGNFGYTINFTYDELIPQIESYILQTSDYNSGYNDGFNSGYSDGYDDGTTSGYTQGYTDGVTYAQSQNQTALTIFQGIVTIGLLPINFFLAMLNFEVFGINIGGAVSAILTIAIVVIITRIIVSGGSGGKDK